MSKDDRDKGNGDDPAEHLKQGLGHLFRAAQGVAHELKKEIDRTDWGKQLDDAGRELVRAATNVIERVGTELTRPHGGGAHAPGEAEQTPGGDAQGAPGAGEGEGAARSDAKAHDEARDERGAEREDAANVEPKPKGPTPADPGFRIAVDEPDDPPRS